MRKNRRCVDSYRQLVSCPDKSDKKDFFPRLPRRHLLFMTHQITVVRRAWKSTHPGLMPFCLWPVKPRSGRSPCGCLWCGRDTFLGNFEQTVQTGEHYVDDNVVCVHLLMRQFEKPIAVGCERQGARMGRFLEKRAQGWMNFICIHPLLQACTIEEASLRRRPVGNVS